ACATSRSTSRAPARDVSRRSARCSLPVSRSASFATSLRFPTTVAARPSVAASDSLTRGLSSHGSLHWTCLSAVPARRHEALPQGRALLHRQVRLRAALLPAGTARPSPPPQAVGLRRA